MVDDLPDQVYVKDTEGRYLFNNAKHVEALGAASSDEVAGKSDFNFYPKELAERYRADEQTNGSVKRFNRVTVDEFFQEALHRKSYESVEALQRDFDKWLRYYNMERSHPDYPNVGRRPVEMLNEYLRGVRSEE